ncbi:MAG: ParB/RepB/Spo0J family partition protein [Rhodospirillaceae bacterium]
MSEDIRKAEGGKRTGLGRGLSALFGEASEDYASLDRVRQTKQVPVEFLFPGRFQPRRKFDELAISELAQSVKEKGVLQPLLVRRHPDRPNAYEIIAGERRWRAAQSAALHEVPVVVRDLTDREALEISIIENVQRQDLTPLEEAEGYRRLLDEFQHTQENLARSLGKSRSHIANTLRLMGLPEPIKLMLHDGALTAGHARALLTAANPIALAEKIVADGLNVRQTEALAKGEEAAALRPALTGGKAGAEKDADLLSLEESLSEQLGLKVQIATRGKGGSLTITYKSLDQLDDVLRRLTAE